MRMRSQRRPSRNRFAGRGDGGDADRGGGDARAQLQAHGPCELGVDHPIPIAVEDAGVPDSSSSLVGRR